MTGKEKFKWPHFQFPIFNSRELLILFLYLIALIATLINTVVGVVAFICVTLLLIVRHVLGGEKQS
jgi:uncharacterized membrane protein